MTRPLPSFPGYEPGAPKEPDAPFDGGTPVAGVGHNNPPEPVIDLDALKALTPDELFNSTRLAEELAKLEEQAKLFEGDVTTEKGRKAIKSFAYRLTRAQTILDDKGKEKNSGLRVEIDKTDEKRRDLRKTIDSLIATVEKPVIDWEAAEEKRVTELDLAVQTVRAAGLFTVEPTMNVIDNRIALLEKYTAYDWQERADEAKPIVEQGLNTLRGMKATLAERIAQQAELARLREAEAKRQAEEQAKAEAEAAAEAARVAEAERQRLEQERIEREAAIAEAARKEAEEKAAQAERDRVAAEQRAAEQAAQAERDRIAAEEKAAAEAKAAEERRVAEAAAAEERRLADLAAAEARAKAEADAAAQRERDRIAAEQEAARKAEEARQADIEHRRKINNDIVAALRAVDAAYLMTEMQAQAIVEAIARGKIPHTKINY